MRARALLAALTGLAAAASAQAEEPTRVGGLEIVAPYTRATAPTASVAAGYMRIRNLSDAPDRLMAGETTAAGRLELHEMAMDAGVMRMREIDGGIEIPAGETVSLEPGGLHVMFMALAAPFVEGETIEVTLRFEAAGETTIAFPVAAPGATAAPHGAHGGHGGHAGHSQ